MKRSEIWKNNDFEVISLVSFSFSRGDYPINIYECGKAKAIYSAKIQRNSLQYYIIEYIISGSGILEYDGKAMHVEAGDVWILHKGNKSYTYYPDDKNLWNKIYINLDGTLINNLILSYSLTDAHLFKGFKNQQLFEDIFDTLNNATPPRYESIVLNFCIKLHEILQKCYILNSTKHAVSAGKIRRIIENNVLNPNFNMKYLADIMFTSQANIINIFKKEYDTTPLKFYNKLRIDYACNLLTNSKLSIMEISNTLNFNDQHYFSNFFKKQLKISPYEYRNLKKHNEEADVLITKKEH